MSRYDKETLRAKIEWEGTDGIDWFKPEEVPEELQDLWEDTLNAKNEFEYLMDRVMEALDDEE